MSTSELSTYAPQGTVPQTMAAGGRRPPRKLLLGMMVAVFFSGGVIGSGSTLMLINRRIEDNEKHHNDPIFISKRVVQELEEKLSLNGEQTTQVDQIMKDHFAALDRLRREVFFKEIRKQFKQMEDQVNAVLDDQQRTQWHAWLDEKRQRVCPLNSRHSSSAHGNSTSRGRPPADGTAGQPANLKVESPDTTSTESAAGEPSDTSPAAKGQDK